ncbi:DnaD domain protein [Gemella morbillorum]
MSEKTTAKEVKQIHNDNEEVWKLSNIERSELVKSRSLLITNLANKMNSSQNVLFSFALLNANIEDDFAESEFSLTALSKFLNNQNYQKYDTRRILKDLKTIAENSLLMMDEEMVANPQNGKAKGILIFSDYSYSRGIYHLTFNSTPIGKKRLTPIIDLLRSKEDNPLIYNLATFSKLNSRGQSLYEHLLIATAQNKKKLRLSLEELRGIFKANGKSMERFNAIKTKHLIPALLSINKNTGLDVKMEPIKESRRIVGINLYWSQEKVKLPSTEKQISLMHDFYVQLSKLNLTSKEDVVLLSQLKDPQLLDREQASKAIAKAKKIRDTFKSAQNLIENQKEDVELLEQYTDFFNKFPNVTNSVKESIVVEILKFSEEYREQLLEYAYNLYLQNGASSLNYIVTTLQEWSDNNVTSLADARKLHDDTYGPSYEPLPNPDDIEISPEFEAAMNLWSDKRGKENNNQF